MHWRTLFWLIFLAFVSAPSCAQPSNPVKNIPPPPPPPPAPGIVRVSGKIVSDSTATALPTGEEGVRKRQVPFRVSQVVEHGAGLVQAPHAGQTIWVTFPSDAKPGVGEMYQVDLREGLHPDGGVFYRVIRYLPR